MGCALTTEGTAASTAPGSGRGRVETPGYSSVVPPPSDVSSNRSFGSGSQGGANAQQASGDQTGPGSRIANLPISRVDNTPDSKRYSLSFPPADDSWNGERESRTPLNPHLLHPNPRNGGTPGLGLGFGSSFGENNRFAAGLGSIGNESCNELGEGRSETSYCCSEGPPLSLVPQYIRGSYYAEYSQQEELMIKRRLIGGFIDSDGVEYLAPSERFRRLDDELMQLRLEKSKRQCSTPPPPPPAVANPKQPIGTGDGILWSLPSIQRGLPIRLSALNLGLGFTDSTLAPTARPPNSSPSILLPDLTSPPASSLVSPPFTTSSWKAAIADVVTMTNHAFNEEQLSLSQLHLAIGRIEWLFTKHPASEYPPRRDMVLLYTLLVTLHDTVVLLQQPVRFLENFNQVDTTGIAFDGEVLVKDNLEDSAFSSPHRVQVKCETLMSDRMDAAIEDAVGLFAARQTKVVSYILALLEELLQYAFPY